jgi:arabinogalactan endo-1,4-beta-galactosidase
MLTKYEEAGVVYKNKSGNTVQALTFFKEQGLNAMRVRLFVDPSKASAKHKGEGVCQDLAYVKALGKRIKDCGMKLMLDFHYSDTWADPSNQWTPDAWKDLNDEQLCNKIYEYTKDCLSQMKEAGATPDFIQTGNEISYGMLWGTEGSTANRCYTSSPNANWTRFINLLKKAGEACREECPDAKIIIHSERTPKPNVLTDFFDRMKNASLDYDIIGLSYYPAHHGNLAALETALTTLENKNYGKDIMVVETGYCYAWPLADSNNDGKEDGFDYTATYPYTEEGQRQYTAALIAKLNSHSSVKGLFWWWPEDNGNKNVTAKWWNAALYNHSTGKPYAALYELKNFVNDPAGIEQISNTHHLSPNTTCYNLLGQRLQEGKGLCVANGKKFIVK